MSNDFPPLPTLMLDSQYGWEWPEPPFARRRMMAPPPAGAQPCRVETVNGAAVEGEMTKFDPTVGELSFRVGRDGAPLALHFSKFRRLTLTQPWERARRSPDAPVERLPPAMQERDYSVTLPGGGNIGGRTLGHVRHDAGYFLFAPVGLGEQVLRQFVPHAAVAQLEFGRSAEEVAIERWVATPADLVAAVEAQRGARILPLGDALLDLGLVSRGQLEQVLADQGPDRELPLGELLILRGLIDRADLQTAMAHKMGYPIVDLTRFPLDAVALKHLSPRAMTELRALPLLKHGKQLYIAVDELSRIPPLRGLESMAGIDIVPVLAPHARLAIALEAVLHRSDVWANNVPTHLKSVNR